MRRLVVVLVLAAFVASACADDKENGDETPVTKAVTKAASAPAVEPEGTVTYSDLDQTHVDTPVAYAQTPPVGGPHDPVWQTCQFYDVEFPKERGVHSLEHGAVWITFSPDLASDEIAMLAQFADTGEEVLVSPFTGLPSPIVASAWGKQLLVESVTDPRLAQFVDFFDDGPQAPELGVPCAGGTTETS